MKKNFMIMLLMLVAFTALNATLLINENIQNWTNHTSYGNYTQTISAGTVSMTDCIVASGAAATGTCSIGRVQLKATTGILEFPALPSVGTAEFHFAAGAAGRSVILQKYSGSTWMDVTTFTAIGTTGATYSYDLNQSSSTTLRLATPSAALYVHDIIISDFGGGTPVLPTLSTAAISAITATTATSGGNITSDGGASVTARGVCWSTSHNPVIGGSHTSNGTGSGSFVSNITGLSASTLYYVRAYATNSQGTAYGDELSFTTSGTSPPPAPTATDASNVSSSSFTANWNAATGATGYYLDVSLYNTFSSFVSGYNALQVSGTTQDVSSLNASTTYYYRVRAYNANGSSTNSNTITVTTLVNDPFNGYYNSVTGLSGSALKTGLHNLVRTTHTHEYSYSNLETQMKITDEDPDNSNNVIEIYTGWSVPKSSYGGTTTSWNKEHTWSKSHGDFGDVAPAGTDLHHLRPCDATVNSFKSNRDFDEGTTAYTDASPPSGYTGNTGCYYTTANEFEPRDEDKGDVARMIFYMATRYEGTDTSYDLELVDYVYSDAGTNQPYYGKLSTLLAWHEQDPPDAWEALRNNRIQNLQGNRNPFIDHPEYVGMIWGTNTGTTTVQFNPYSAVVNEASGSITLSLQITNPSSTAATTLEVQLTSGSAADVGSFATRTITFPAGSSTSQTTSVTITNDTLLEGTEHLVFTIANVSGGFYAAAGNYHTFNLVILDDDIPTPVATAATSNSFTGFTAHWNAAPGITDYEFDLSTSATFSSFVEGYEALPVTGTSLALTGLNQGQTYYYRLRCVYNASYGNYSGTITTNTLLPDVTLSITRSGANAVLSWPAVSGATSYRIEAATDPFGSFSPVATTANLTYSTPTLSRKFFRVIAIK